MFKHSVNAACINDLFSVETISGMRIDAPHPSFQRLLEALGAATAALPRSRRVCDEVGLRGALGISPQTANNWKTRGVSVDAAIDAQRRFSISATWLLDGSGPQLIGGPLPTPADAKLPDLVQVVDVLAQALAAGMPDAVREDLADALAKLARRKGADHDRRQVVQLLVPPEVALALRGKFVLPDGDPGGPQGSAPAQELRPGPGRHTSTAPTKRPRQTL